MTSTLENKRDYKTSMTPCLRKDLSASVSLLEHEVLDKDGGLEGKDGEIRS